MEGGSEAVKEGRGGAMVVVVIGMIAVISISTRQ